MIPKLRRAGRALKYLNAEEAKNYDAALLQNPKFYIGAGCDTCGGIGYFGRVGIYEIMIMNNKLRRLILEGASMMEVEKSR